MRVACDVLGLPMAGHVSIEQNAKARRVVEAFFPDSTFHDNVLTVDEAMVRDWSLKFSNAGVVLIGAGPPCQGVSGLNADKRGALKDPREQAFLRSAQDQGVGPENLLLGASPFVHGECGING